MFLEWSPCGQKSFYNSTLRTAKPPGAGPRGFAVRTGRNETRFVLPKVKSQSRQSSGDVWRKLLICDTDRKLTTCATAPPCTIQAKPNIESTVEQEPIQNQ